MTPLESDGPKLSICSVYMNCEPASTGSSADIFVSFMLASRFTVTATEPLLLLGTGSDSFCETVAVLLRTEPWGTDVADRTTSWRVRLVFAVIFPTLQVTTCPAAVQP